MTSRKPITPTKVIPAGQPLPAPASPPPQPPAPPSPPAPPALPPWWAAGPPPPPPPQAVDVYVHVEVATTSTDPDPEPGPRWWQRLRIGCGIAGFMVCGPWAWVLNGVHHHGVNGLLGAWVMALIVLTVIAVWDNACRIAAKHADPEAWIPQIRATVARVLLWTALWAIVLTLPVSTIVFLITGVQP